MSEIEAPPRSIALRFEPEAFELGKARIMGRQAAGSGFLRALIGALGAELVHGFGPNPAVAKELASLAETEGGGKPGSWIRTDQAAELARIGTLHNPDPSLAEAGRHRRLSGVAAWSITGVTHTTASESVMRSVAAMAAGDAMPWDALICTSQSVLATVTTLLEDEEQRLRLSVGATRFLRPQLPVIPLGVDVSQLAGMGTKRGASRLQLGLAEHEIAFLFVGRLSFHAKAHPYQMYRALDDIAQETGRPLVLIQCGWFANEGIRSAFVEGAEQFAPNLRHVFLDGRIEEQRQLAWSASDAFLSLSDNIQETFGLAPLEAMAAGLPVIASDWDGYRESVRHETDGFLIPTQMPAAGISEPFGRAHAAGKINYDHYLANTSLRVSIEGKALRDAIRALVMNPALRQQMGKDGQRRAREKFDWPLIIKRYVALWGELEARRRSASQVVPLELLRPRSAPVSVYRLFADYPSRVITAAARALPVGPAIDWQSVASHPLFSGMKAGWPDPKLLDAVAQASLQDPPVAFSDLAEKLGASLDLVIDAAALLAKWEVVSLDTEQRPQRDCVAALQGGTSLEERVRSDLSKLITSPSAAASQLPSALRLLAKWRATRLQTEWVRRMGTKVQSGPLSGLKLSETAIEGCHIPKLIGCYEQPLSHSLETLLKRKPELVFNVGCAEGYYAVGIAQRLPKAEVHAFDINPRAQAACAQLAEENGVAKRVKIGGRFEPENFSVVANRPSLIVCDIEGAERDLFTNADPAHVRRSDLIIECHEAVDTDMVHKITSILVGSHDVTIIKDQGTREVRLPDWVNKLSALDQILLTWEWREAPTPWIVARAPRA